MKPDPYGDHPGSAPGPSLPFDGDGTGTGRPGAGSNRIGVLKSSRGRVLSGLAPSHQDLHDVLERPDAEAQLERRESRQEHHRLSEGSDRGGVRAIRLRNTVGDAVHEVELPRSLEIELDASPAP